MGAEDHNELYQRLAAAQDDADWLRIEAELADAKRTKDAGSGKQRASGQ